MNENLSQAFTDYGESHQTEGNLYFHAVGIPLFVFSTFGLLQGLGTRITMGEGLEIFFSGQARALGLGLGELLASNAAALGLWIFTSIFYLRLDFKLGIEMTFLNLLLLLVAGYVPPEWHLFMFLSGWGMKFWGHYYFEKRSPKFFKSLQHLLIGPLWLLAKARRRA